jgi:ATP-dependent Clp protease ATP-binding subunit ClpB
MRGEMMDTPRRSDERVILTLENICTALSAWTGIPPARLVPGRMGGDDYVQLRQKLEENIFGQSEAIDAVVSALERRLELPERPGVKRPLWNAMFAGPSGVGKTEFAKQLAIHFFEDPRKLIQIDCSELDREHHIDRLVGSPPGYVGHGQGGQLTNELNRCRHGVLLLDEVEKAHPVILTKVVLPLLGEGMVHDMNTGKLLDASNMAVVLTSNCGTNETHEAAVGFARIDKDPNQAQEKAVRDAINQHFPREVLDRIDDVVIFTSLSGDAVRRIWQRELASLAPRMAQRGHPVRIEMAATAEALMLHQIENSVRIAGARAITRFFDRAVVDHCLRLLSECECIQRIVVESVGSQGVRFRGE